MESTAGGDGSDTECSDAISSGEADIKNGLARRKNSFVWNYFRFIQGGKSCECVICNASVGHKTTSNLARHLAASHNIVQGDNIRGRPSRSFIWKYCTKENSKHARCHLCKKLLYFGGGNTANIAKHLRRRHPEVVQQKMPNDAADGVEELPIADTSTIVLKTELPNNNLVHDDEDMTDRNEGSTADNSGSGRKERKGGSYVWNYCDKLSRHNIRCNLCNKTMSFHGTANIITHLQRRHNILGKIECDKNDTNALDSPSADNLLSKDLKGVEDAEEEQLSEDEMSEFNSFTLKRRKRSQAATSVVWKYCKRISMDAVRCKFCKKNLSYQGTSNLQRHLHRMHGVVTHARAAKDGADNEDRTKQFSNMDFIWEHCTLDDDNIKCNMCSGVFSMKQMEAAVKHLTGVHSIRARQSLGAESRGQHKPSDSIEDSSGNEYDDDWNKLDPAERELEEANEPPCTKKVEALLYNELIEEEHDMANCDEDPFDPSMVHEMPLANPLSPQSSDDDGRDSRMFMNGCKRLRELKEARMRTETEYFREKAGFYRMQKYLTALQAKKVRLELERLHASAANEPKAMNAGGSQKNQPT